MIAVEERITEDQRRIIDEFTSEYPVKIGGLAKALGLKVLKATFSPKISGQIKPSTECVGGYEIKVNRYDIPERQRFTIAHEIAHYLLHRDLIGDGIVDNVLYRSKLSNRVEAEANRLAAELVMPRRLLRSRLTDHKGELSVDLAEELAEQFRVSLPAMKIRLGVD